MTWLLPVALAIGLLLGLLGGGGAILTVPVLTTVAGQTPPQATAGSLVIVGASALVGCVPHLRAGRVRVVDGVSFGLLGIVGALAGSRLSAAVPGPVLMSAFSLLMLVVAMLMIRKLRRSGCPGAQPGRAAGSGDTRGDAPDTGAAGWPIRIVAATGVGLLTGFFGVGGGFVIVPALTLVMGLPMPTAVGTSLLVIAINSASSLAFRVVRGAPVDWGVVLPFAALTVLGTLLGARLSGRVDQRVLHLAFIVLLVAVAIGVAAQNIPRLAQ